MKNTRKILYWIISVIIGIFIFGCCIIAAIPVFIIVALWNLLSKIEDKLVINEQ